MKSISSSILELIWNGLMVDVESILAPFGINVGSFWKQIGVRLGSILGSGWGPWRDLAGVRAPDPVGTRFLAPWTDFGAFFGFHVGPMLALVGRLGPSWRVLGAILSLS